jgi:hypothetical protein
MKTILALVTALAFTAPLAATAATQSTAQKVQQTYHLNFQANQQAEAVAGGR